MSSLDSYSPVDKEKQVLVVAAQLLETLFNLHVVKWCHLDVSPGNVMVQWHSDHPWDTLRLVDFGFAKQFETGDLADGFDTCIRDVKPDGATMPYASPEQLRSLEIQWGGENLYDELLINGHASDMFSAGVVLYEALTGELPFRPRASRDKSSAAEYSQQIEIALNAHKIVMESHDAWEDAVIAAMDADEPVEHPLLDKVRDCSANPDAAADFFLQILHPYPYERLSGNAFDHPYVAGTCAEMEAYCKVAPVARPMPYILSVFDEDHHAGLATGIVSQGGDDTDKQQTQPEPAEGQAALPAAHLADAQKSAEVVSTGSLHRSHKPRSEDTATGVSAALTASPSISPHTAVPGLDSITVQSAASPVGSRHNAICSDHQVLTLPADGQGHSCSLNGSLSLNGHAQHLQRQSVTGFAPPEARRSGLLFRRPTTLTAKQKTTQRKPVARLLNIFRRPGRSPKADQGSRGTLTSIAQPDTAALFGTSASEAAKQSFRPSKGEVKLDADASLQQNTQPGYQVGSAEDSEQGLAKCKSPSSLQQAVSQGVSVSAVRVTEKSQDEETPPGAGTVSPDDSESAGVQPASEQEAQGQPTAQTSDRDQTNTSGKKRRWLRKPKAVAAKAGKGFSAAGAALGKALCFGPSCCRP
ncbi:TPA: hypothetical protein ACH3X2_008978 [Trebouxia sp. C0005]